MKTTFYERFAEYFAEQGNAEQVAIFNEWAYSTGNEPINFMGEFDEVCAGFSPLDIALRVRFGNFNPNHDYFTFDGYANLESIENVAEWLEDYVDEMADYYENHFRVLANVIGIREACDLYDVDEEEEEDEE
jgi:hypothetical protein